MSRRIILSPDARADFRSAVRWYQRKQLSLVWEFKAELQTTLRRIGQLPYAFRPLDQEDRRALMRRFPYYIYFRFDGNTLLVTGIIHQRQADSSWLQRRDDND